MVICWRCISLPILSTKLETETKSGKEKRERKDCVCLVQILGISRLRLSPQALLYCLLLASPVCGKQQHFLPPTSIVSTVFAEFSRKMRSQWVSGGQGLTRCQGSSWKSHQADGKKFEKQERRNGRGKIRLGREIKMFSPTPILDHPSLEFGNNELECLLQ